MKKLIISALLLSIVGCEKITEEKFVNVVVTFDDYKNSKDTLRVNSDYRLSPVSEYSSSHNLEHWSHGNLRTVATNVLYVKELK